MGRDKEGLRHRAQTSAQPDLQDTEVVRRRMMRMLMVMMMMRIRMRMTAMMKNSSHTYPAKVLTILRNCIL